MSLSRIFSGAALAIAASFIGYGDTPHSRGVTKIIPAAPKLSEAEEIAFTQKLGQELPTVDNFIEFLDVAEVSEFSKPFNDLDVRKLAYAMIPSYKERCGDPVKRKDICHVDRIEAFNVVTYAWHIEFGDKSMGRLAKKLTHKYAAERSYTPYRANCYAFAVGDYFLNPIGGADVGDGAYGLKNTPIKNTQDVVEKAVADGLHFAGNDPQKLKIPSGKRLILLYVHQENGVFEDYHWTRIDRQKDGQLIVGQKMGIMKSSSSHILENIYEEMRSTFSNEGEGYKFVGFFYAPIEGLDVGYDAYGRKHGVVPPLLRKLNEIPNHQDTDRADFNTLKVLFLDERTPS